MGISLRRRRSGLAVELKHCAAAMLLPPVLVVVLFVAAPTRTVGRKPWQVEFGYSPVENGRLKPSVMLRKTAKTLLLTLGASAVTLLCVMPAAYLLVLGEGRLRKVIIQGIAYCFSVVPIFITGTLALFLCGAEPGGLDLDFSGVGRRLLDLRSALGIHPYCPIVEGFDLTAFILPCLMLGIGNGGLAFLLRQFRTELESLYRAPHVTALRARGLSPHRSVMRSGAVVLTSILTNHILELLGGAIIIERIFNVYGIGSCAFDAASARDFYLALAVTVLMGMVYTIARLLGLLIQRLFDRRPPAVASLAENT
ncbi:ABC transporter permease subunit [bacterium]|nr:ABC transporter permease subunit [candidate division CSSED10-310 bacterium]